MTLADEMFAAGLDVRKTAELAQRTRRDAVEKLHGEGVSWAKIAKRLGCAQSTVEKDIAALRTQGRLS